MGCPVWCIHNYPPKTFEHCCAVLKNLSSKYTQYHLHNCIGFSKCTVWLRFGEHLMRWKDVQKCSSWIQYYCSVFWWKRQAGLTVGNITRFPCHSIYVALGIYKTYTWWALCKIFFFVILLSFKLNAKTHPVNNGKSTLIYYIY